MVWFSSLYLMNVSQSSDLTWEVPSVTMEFALKELCSCTACTYIVLVFVFLQICYNFDINHLKYWQFQWSWLPHFGSQWMSKCTDLYFLFFITKMYNPSCLYFFCLGNLAIVDLVDWISFIFSVLCVGANCCLNSIRASLYGHAKIALVFLCWLQSEHLTLGDCIF